MGEAQQLGRRLAEAALIDDEGREEYSEEERYVDYVDHPFSVVEPCLDNLTNGTMEYDTSLIAEGLENFERSEAVALLQQAREPFERALKLYQDGKQEAACHELVRASALWTHATWTEFLEQDVIKSGVPEAYRPMEDARG